MSDGFVLPPDEVMKAMAKLAFENAAEYFARMAVQFAADLPPAASGHDALTAFAAAIRSTNAKLYPTQGAAS